MLRLDTAAQTHCIAEFTHPELILPQLREQDAAGIIGELAGALKGQGVIPDILPFYHAALNQELLASPALNSGIVVPHARSASVRMLQFALGRTSKPIPWKGKEEPRIRLIFLVAIPATEATRYLRLLSAIARLARDPATVDRLHSAQSAEDIYLALRDSPIAEPGVAHKTKII